jgi:hypothetical protein
MNRMHASRFLILTFAVALFVQVGCLLVPNDKVTGERVANLRPSVRITDGAATPDPAGVDYKVQFFWSGSDVDGVIDYYQWAVDDTVTENAWRDTTGFSARFNFKAARQAAGNDMVFTDWHTFYIRAIDNEFSFSKPDKRYFNARTIAPVSRITFPMAANLGQLAQLERTVVVKWEGEDIDSSRPDGKPLAYEYKLVRVASMPDEDDAYVDSLRNGRNLLDSLGVGSPSKWIRVPRTTNQLTLRDLPIDALLAFGVRAVDEAGAIEPSLENRRNFIVFAVSGESSQPTVEVREVSLGSFRFPLNGSLWEIEVPPGVPLRFEWRGNADAYGSKPGMVNYALDIPDPENESLRDPKGIKGWIGWGSWPKTQFPIAFTMEEGGTTHYLYILMRDISDNRSSTQRCVIKMNVVPFTFSKTAVVIDDARFDSPSQSDVLHDAFLNRSILRRLRTLGDVGDLVIWPDFNEGGRTPVSLRLEDVADYQTIVWSLNGVGSIDTGLGSARNQAVLSSFLKAGGRLFLFGANIVGYSNRQLVYPLDPPDPGPDQDKLYFKFLYMRKEIVSAKKTTDPDACFNARSGLFAARSANPAYPDLFLDGAKWNPWAVNGDEYKGGVGWEGTMVGMNQNPEPSAGLDTLYTAETWNLSNRPVCGIARSVVEGAVIAARYQSTRADTLEGRQHGRVVWFDFQPWWFQQDRLMDAGTAAVNWLLTGRDQ